MHMQRFGGDNRDHGKGFVLHHLSDELRDLRVDPMVTDDDLVPGPDRGAFTDAYRRFLRLADGHQIVNGQLSYRGNAPVLRDGKEEPYFQPHFGQEYDLFLDPDIGIGEGGCEYVPVRVIPDLVRAGSERVLLVYVTSNWSDPTWKWLLDQASQWADGRLQAFVCDLGGSGILFLANKGNDRLKYMRGNLSNVFGPLKEWRVKS